SALDRDWPRRRDLPRIAGRRYRPAGPALCRRLAADDRGDDAADGVAIVSPVRHAGAAARRSPAADRVVDRRLPAGVGGGWRGRASARCDLARRGTTIGVADAERLGDRRGGACRRRPLPVQPAQIPLPRQVPHALRLYRAALAWATTIAQRLPARLRPRPLLRWLLL